MSHWLRRWFVPLLCGGGLLVAALWWGPSERQQWQLAMVAEARLNEDYATALAGLSRLIDAHPSRLDWQMQRVGLWIEAERQQEATEALETLSALEDLPFSQTVEASRLWGLLQAHPRAYQLLQRAHGQLLDRLDVKGEAPARPRDLPAQERLLWANNLGYYAYLADADLPQRFADLDETLQQNSVEEQIALYRSQALRIVGRSSEAQPLVTRTAERLAGRLQAEEADLETWVGNWMLSSDWPTATEPLGIRHKRSSVMEMRLMLRILWEQAAVLSRDLGDETERRQFLARAAATRVSRDHIQFDLSPQVVAQQLVHFAIYLDTRGALATKLERWEQAQTDLDAAIQANYLAQAITWEFGLENNPAMVDVRQLRQVQNQGRRALAIYHYHRGLLQAAQGNTAAADLDWQTVQRLGFQPGPELH